MAHEFQVYGYYEIPYTYNEKTRRSKQIDEDKLASFWEQPQLKKLSKKRGVYIFAVKAGKGFTPWYVGRTSKQSLLKEVFDNDKVRKYNKLLFPVRNGIPVLFFIAPIGNKNVANSKIIGEIEKYIIKIAKQRNKKLLNVVNANPPQWRIKGVIRWKGKPDSTAQVFNKMMGI